MAERIEPKVKCLLVDDLEENLLALAALLQGEGVETLLARSGREALELLLQHDVALALLDVRMPEMDGFELAELMRSTQRTRHVPLIFVTAEPRDQRRLFKGYDTGAVDFLYKPIDSRILRNKASVFFQLQRQKLQLAQELRERTETLRLNEMFTAVLGHDLRNPLSAMLMQARLIQRTAGDASVRGLAERMLTSGTRMSRMIEDMLDLARARLGGGLALQRQACELDALVQRIVQEHAIAHPAQRIEMQQTGDLRGPWDPDRLAQVASNLIGNALQHGEPGAAVEVRLDGSAAEAVVLEVANAGVIAPELLPLLFDPFRSGERRDAQHDGLGLGLYIVQQIVRAHEGSVDVRCGEAARVTTFRVSLPRGVGGEG